MYNYIFLLGAPGVGKTTIARLLKEQLNSPYLDYDWIRGFHLNKDWSNRDNKEKAMSLENLFFILKNYKKNGFCNVLVGGFRVYDMKKILKEFKDDNFIIITLFLTNDNILKERVLTETRDSGWRDFKNSIEFNRRLKNELKFPNEYKIDNTNKTPQEAVDQIIGILSKEKIPS